MQPRWYQDEAINSIFEYFETRAGNPVIAAPTGTGKSIIIAEFIRRVMQRWPSQRFLVATHVKELIEQNAAKMSAVWPHAPYGIFSAGLNSKEYQQPIIFGGVQSMAKVATMFGWRDLLIIDECHLLNPKDGTLYMLLINELKKINPNLKVIGLSATVYRMGMGLITDGGLFTDVCYDLTTMEMFDRLLAENYISLLIPKKTNVEIDTNNLHIASNGDYVQSELETATEKITYQAIQEAMKYGYNRKSWLIFCAGVKHAIKTREILLQFGVPTTIVHSNTKDFKMKDIERDKNLSDFKYGQYLAITNNNVLTTGFDHPPIDMIIMLRATMSTSLWVQMLGRGMRPFGGDAIFPPKENCLVLDFAGNTRRLGPVNDPVIPKRKGGGGGEVPVKICDWCGTYNHISARVCTGCGEEFTFAPKIVEQAGTDEVMRSELPVVEVFEVDRVFYARTQTKAKPLPWLKVTYFCKDNLIPFSENVMLEHTGYASKKARDWWRIRHPSEPPETIEKALELVSELKVPNKIRVWVNKQYPEILGYE
jgi:DNA repair protein RadD